MKKAVLFFGLTLAACASQKPAEDAAKPAAKAAEGGEKKAAPAASASALPDFALETTEGETFRLSDHLGKDVIVMSFWATWCEPCKVELPHLEDIYQDMKEQGLVIVAVSMDEPTSVAQVAPTAQRLGLTMPVALDTDQRAVQLYNRSRNAPMTVVIDRAGRIVKQAAGYNPGDEKKLAEELAQLVAK